MNIKSFNQVIARRCESKFNSDNPNSVFNPGEVIKIKDIAEEKRMLIPSDVGKFSDP